MKIEKLNYGKEKNKRMFLYGFLVAVVLLVLVNIIASKAMYRKTESVQLATGTVNYSLADVNIIAMYQEKEEHVNEDDKYENIEEIPTSGYGLNKEKSVCKLKDNKEEDIEINIINSKITISNITKKGTKCYLYFDKQSGDKTLLDLGLEKSPNGCPTVEDGVTQVTGIEKSQSLICSALDDDGKSYYFRGTTDNNWVKFGQTTDNKDIWWRILRINGDGTIRLIYAGEGTSVSGNGTNAISGIQYNTAWNDNTYVGYYIGSTGGADFTETHSNKTQSNIATKTESWFIETNLDEKLQLNHIDENAGFCNNRQISSKKGEWCSREEDGVRGTGEIYTAYKGFSKTYIENGSWKTDVNYADLRCSSSPEDYKNNADYIRDYYTWKGHATRGNQALANPVGQITLDELILAGGFGVRSNSNYWLYTGGYYWTMSPLTAGNVSASVFTSYTDGQITGYNVGDGGPGVRPVINLKADTKFSFSQPEQPHGTKNNPYIVID